MKNNPIHYSGIKEFLRCPYLYHLSYFESGQGIDTYEQNKEALTFGTLFHEAMENLLIISGKDKPTLELANQVISNMEDKINSEKISDNKRYSLPFMVKSTVKFLSKNIIPEKKFYNKEFNFYGKVDGYDPNNKMLYEFKTTSNITDKMKALAVQKIQDKIYATFLSLSGSKVEKIKHIIVAYPALRQKKDESSVEFKRRIIQDQFFKTDKYIYVEEKDFTEEIMSDTVRQIQAISRTIQMSDLYFKNTDACFDYGLCKYYDFCINGHTFPYVQKEEFNLDEYREF